MSLKSFTRVFLRYCVPLVITVGLCYLLFRGMDIKEMLATIRSQCDFRWIWLNVAMLIGAMWARAARWRIQLKALGINAPLWELVLSVFGTYAVNMVFPRLGEVWRTGYVAQQQKAPFTVVFGSMVADRLSDTVVVGLISLLAFMLAGPQLVDYLSGGYDFINNVMTVVTSPLLWSIIALFIAVVIFLFRRYPDNKIISTCRKLWDGLWDGFVVIGRMKGKGMWLLYTVVIWSCYFLGLGCAFMSFPLLAEVLVHNGVTALLLCFVLTSLSMLVPSNGGIGPWQWAMIFGLSLYSADIPGLTKEYMASFANLALGVQAVTSIILGLFTFIWIALHKSSTSKISAL